MVLIENYIEFIFLHRRKSIEIRDLNDNYRDFNKNLQDPNHIRDLKLNEILC